MKNVKGTPKKMMALSLAVVLASAQSAVVFAQENSETVLEQKKETGS